MNENATSIEQAKAKVIQKLINPIMHQWKQPLNSINMGADFLYEIANSGEVVTVEDIKSCSDMVKSQVKHLIISFDEFRSFLKSDETPKTTTYDEMIDGVLTLLHDYLIKYTVEAKVTLKEDIGKIKLIPHKFKLALVSIVVYILENLVKFEIEKRYIGFQSEVTKEDAILHITSNLNEIEMDDKIFSETNLYLSKELIFEMGGKLEASNSNGTVGFKIKFKREL